MIAPWFARLRPSRPTSPARRARLRRKAAVELLEGRELLSTFTVTNIGDTPAGSADIQNSLRWAIDQANNLAPNTPSTINFAIGTGAQTIELVRPLPTLANPITIDGTTQPGYAGRPLIQVDGLNAGAGAIGFSLDDDSHNSTIQALEITGFNGGGILDDNGNANTFSNDIVGLHYNGTLSRVIANGTFGIEIRDQANGNTISGSVIAGNQYNGIVINNSMNNVVKASNIGTDRSGEDSLDRNGVALGNGQAGGGGSGIVINGGASHNTISNNIIVNNRSYGVYITDAGTTYNTLTNNEIGIDGAGTTALGNGLDGVAVVSGAGYNAIGQAGAGNVISGNGQNGIRLGGTDSTGARVSVNTVAGNLIGTNAQGTASVSNALDGVIVYGQATGNAIGALASGSGSITQVGGNVISGNGQWGVYISDSGTTGNVVQDDHIGTDLTGKFGIANGFNGLDVVNSASGNTVGGTTASARDVISGNANEGVLIGLGATKNVVEGDYIGTDVTGKVALPNALDGIYVGLGAVNNTIGSTANASNQNFASYNVISGNGTNGIKVTDSGTSGTQIVGNFIGTDATGTVAVPNQADGVLLAAGTSGTFIGAASSNVGNLNVISGNKASGLEIDAPGTVVGFTVIGADLNGQKPLGNGGDGVLISGTSGADFQIDVIDDNGGYGVHTINGATQNAVRTSAIYNNALGGILEQGNPSLEPAPQLTGVTSASGTTKVAGTIFGSPSHNAQLSLDFFASPSSSLPAGMQGRTYIGSGTVTTDANGNASFTVTLNVTVPGGQMVTATSSVGISSTSQFSNGVTVPAATATFVKKDATTQGNWIGAYGSKGYDIAGVASGLPSFATVGVTGASTYAWASSTTDVRALQKPGGSGRIAATWFGSSFTIDVNLTDGQTHDLALYAVDWDSTGRGEKIQVIDPATGSVLDTETLSSFHGGDYLQWAVSGHVQIKVTNLSGANAVVSGLFLD